MSGAAAMTDEELDALLEEQAQQLATRKTEAVAAAARAHKVERATEVGPRLLDDPSLLHVELDSATVGDALPGHVLMKRLSKESYQRMKTTIFGGNAEQKALATRQAVLDALLYPSRERFLALEKVVPGVAETCGEPLLKAARAEREAEGKG
jgi:hypothetical protein